MANHARESDTLQPGFRPFERLLTTDWQLLVHTATLLFAESVGMLAAARLEFLSRSGRPAF
jgi:hypothetical protein